MVAAPGFQKAFPINLFKRPLSDVAFEGAADDKAQTTNSTNDTKRRRVCEPLNLGDWSNFAAPVQSSPETKVKECCIEGCLLPPKFGTALCDRHNEISSPSSRSTASTSSFDKFCSSTSSPASSNVAPNSCTPRSASGARLCEVESCFKSAQGRTARCKAHGGGKRCISPNCTKSAQGSTDFCKAHGGGKRCKTAGCTKAARGSTDHCIAHGGGKRCVIDGCTKSAVGSTSHCVKHGGGRRCTIDNCTKSARGGSVFCAKHGTQERKRLAAERQVQTPSSQTFHTPNAFSGPSLLDASVLLSAATQGQQPSFSPVAQTPSAPITPIGQVSSQGFFPESSSTLLAAATLATSILKQQQEQQQQQQQQLLDILTATLTQTQANTVSNNGLASLQATLALLSGNRE